MIPFINETALLNKQQPEPSALIWLLHALDHPLQPNYNIN